MAESNSVNGCGSEGERRPAASRGQDGGEGRKEGRRRAKNYNDECANEYMKYIESNARG